MRFIEMANVRTMASPRLHTIESTDIRCKHDWRLGRSARVGGLGEAVMAERPYKHLRTGTDRGTLASPAFPPIHF
jgi:hypothetical protein